MEKLKLNLDEIKVESFETIQPGSKQGTVLGQQTGTNVCVTCGYTHCDEYTCGDATCAGGTCDGGNTCYCTIDDPGCPTVAATCYNSCGCPTASCPKDTYCVYECMI